MMRPGNIPGRGGPCPTCHGQKTIRDGKTGAAVSCVTCKGTGRMVPPPGSSTGYRTK